MSEFHLEGLRDRALAGTLTEAERAKLEEHRASCSVCRLEQLIVAADRHQELVTDAMLDRVYVSALEASRTPPSVRSSRSRPGRAVALAAALVLLGAGVAAAAVPSVREAIVAAWTPEEAPSPPTPQAPKRRPAATRSPEPIEPPIEEPVPHSETPVAEEPRVPTAEALFLRARDARRAGQHGDAARAYRLLQRRYPGSSRAQLSRISLGALLLGPLGDPAGALAQYEAYLARSPRGALAEQAIVGRARALGQLGRGGEARRAWETLLEVYPDSLHAPQARRALGNR
ncbi:MAG: tetratricopeptide repeat protein [Myxococcota bacterium]